MTNQGPLLHLAPRNISRKYPIFSKPSHDEGNRFLSLRGYFWLFWVTVIDFLFLACCSRRRDVEIKKKKSENKKNWSTVGPARSAVSPNNEKTSKSWKKTFRYPMFSRGIFRKFPIFSKPNWCRHNMQAGMLGDFGDFAVSWNRFWWVKSSDIYYFAIKERKGSGKIEKKSENKKGSNIDPLSRKKRGEEK